MTEFLQKNELDEDELYLSPQIDQLGVLSSTRDVVERGEYVWINVERVESLAREWLDKEQQITPTWYDRYHFFDGTQRTVNWILSLDAIAFGQKKINLAGLLITRERGLTATWRKPLH